MEQKKPPPFQDQRQQIHDLTLQKHTGLSPPELEVLEHLEANELLDARSIECSGIFLIIGGYKNETTI